MKKAIALILAASIIFSCAGCDRLSAESSSGGSASQSAQSQEDGSLDTNALLKTIAVEGEDSITTDAQFLKTYSDYAAQQAWLKANIEESKTPPVQFTVDGKSSDSLNWIKETGESEIFTDYPDDNPVQRTVYTITYTAAEVGLQVIMNVTSYPNYPVVEYEAHLLNIAKENSGEIKDVLAINAPIYPESEVKLYANHGATPDGMKQFAPEEYDITAGGKAQTFEVTDGKPTSVWLPYFNAQGSKGGVISVLSWQGNWRADFAANAEGLTMTAGQHTTDFVLFEHEEIRIPMVVLLFYKGDSACGQNIYRRWLYDHNILRAQGARMTTNVLVCVGDDYDQMRGNAADDLSWIEKIDQAGLSAYIDHFNQDAGWYECEPNGWVQTGNWYTDPVRYPNGLIEVSEATRAAGMEYALWLEPERLYSQSQTAKDLPEAIIAIDATGNYIPPDMLFSGKECLINYSIPEAVDYIVEMLDRVITEEGVDQYRQDFNTRPAKHWKAYDVYISQRDGVPRTGITENKYTTGYLKVWEELIKRHPGMIIDSCASGGMRNDLATVRYSFLHTRSDWWQDTDSAQCMTYGSAAWYVLTGGGAVLDTSTNYDLRSRLFTSIGAALDFETPQNTIDLIETWKDQARYMLYDYYPLTTYSESQNAILSMQFSDPATGEGMVAAYVRTAGELTVYPRDLVADASYEFWSMDDESAKQTLTGKKLMEAGIKIASTERAALIYKFQRV